MKDTSFSLLAHKVLGQNPEKEYLGIVSVKISIGCIF